MPDLDIPPGVVKTRSSKSVQGRYVDSDHVRSVNRKPEKWGGWTKHIDTAQVDGLIRGFRGWSSKRGSDLLAGGTHVKFYSISDSFDDITPLRTSGTLGTDPFAVVDTETTVTVTHTGHGVEVGAHVHFSGATAGGGITIDGEYPVVTVPDANSYTIEHSTAATSTDATTGGASVDYEYEINPGLVETTYGLGWGAGTWGDSTWGTPRASGGIRFDLRHWSIARRGSLLAIHPSGGTVYLWDEPSDDDRATTVSNAPSAARSMFITPERMIVMLGTSDPMRMEWCDRDDETVWTPASANTANVRNLQEGNVLIAGTNFDVISLVWSDTACYSMIFRPGSDFIYDTDVVGRGCGLIAPAGYAITPKAVLWWGQSDFHIFSGGVVQSVPRSEEIRDFIFGDESDNTARFNRDKAAKCWADYDPLHRSVIFGYVSLDSADGEPDRYVEVMLEDFSWWIGTLTRTAMAHAESPLGGVFMAGTNSYIYEHNVGVDADSAALQAYVESGIVAMGDGDADMDIDGFEPDFERQAGDLSLTVFTRDRPMSTTDLEENSFTIAEGDDLVDIRMGGRYAAFRIESDAVGGDFRIGLPKIEARRAGRRR